MLEAAGLSAAEEIAYRFLVSVSAATADDVMKHVGLSPSEAGHALAGLCAQGLASGGDQSPQQFSATPPDVALAPRLQRNAEALEKARAAVTDLLDVYRRTRRSGDPHQLIEVITGQEALRQHLRQIQDAATDEMLWFCKAQFVAMPSGSNHAEYDALARGVRYRVLYESAFFDDGGSVANVVRGVRAGEIARAVPHLPVRLAVADRSIGLCPLVPGGPQGSPEEPTAALVRGSSLLEALIDLFERHWEMGVPLRVSESGSMSGTDGISESPDLSETDRRLLSLLLAGVADKAVATQLAMSRRTVQRRIQHMMALAGAGTRMQLAWEAARRGWL